MPEYQCACESCQTSESVMSPEQQAGYVAATRKVTPTIVNLSSEALQYAREASEAMGFDRWMEEVVHRAVTCSHCGHERRNHHDPVAHFGATCLNSKTPTQSQIL